MLNKPCFRLARFLVLLLQLFETSQALSHHEAKGKYAKTTKAYQKEHAHGDLPILGEERGPNGAEWTNSVAICAITKDENTTDVREWIMYHRWIGVEKIYLLENAETPTRQFVKQIEDFMADGLVEYSSEGAHHYQNRWYSDCMRANHHKHNWLAFIDLDEYIVLQEPSQKSLPEFLDEYKHHAGLAAHWVLMGPSERTTRPESGGVMRDYTMCRHAPSPIVKSIANTYFLANIAGNPHTYEYRDGMRAVREHLDVVPWRYDPGCDTLPSNASYHDEVACRPIPDVIARPGTTDRIAVYHFIVKSVEDFAMKVKRGSGGGTHRKWDHFTEVAKMEEHSPTCAPLKTRAEECCNVKEYALKGGLNDL